MLETRHVLLACGAVTFFLTGVVTARALSRDERPAPNVAALAPCAATEEPIPNPVSEAKAEARRSKTSDPLAHGILLVDESNYKVAVHVFRPLADENPEARFWLGHSHLRAGHVWRGCRELRLYLEEDPKGRYVTSAKRDLAGCG